MIENLLNDLKKSKFPGNDQTDSKKATPPTISMIIIIVKDIIPAVLFFIRMLLSWFLVIDGKN